MDTATTAAILAGGQARRFDGRDKSRLIVEGRTIIMRQVEILQTVATEVVIVAADRVRYRDLGLPVYPDRVSGAGALGGIYTALEVSGHDAVLVVACDLPYLHSGLLQRLVERSAGADGAWVRSPRGVEPLLACYRRHTAALVRQQIERGHLKAADLGAILRMSEVGLDELEAFGPADRLLTNINTPADYARVQYRPS
jgi:molybdopterin-guanine dinucleotide biosynthesis protein A